MKLLWKMFSIFLTILLILIMHIFIINFLPFPFNRINVAFSLLLLLSIINPDKKIIWLGLIISYFLELFNGVPFGAGILATLTGLLATNYLRINALTGRSWRTMFSSLTFGIIIYRTSLILTLFINNYFFHHGLFPYKEMVMNAGWEILLSSAFIFLIYIITANFLNRSKLTLLKNKPMYG